MARKRNNGEDNEAEIEDEEQDRNKKEGWVDDDDLFNSKQMTR